MSRDGDRLMLRGSSPNDIVEMSVDGFLWIAECALGSTERAVLVGTQVRVHSEPCK